MNPARNTEQRINDLSRIYQESPQIGLVLGAGVSKESNVPTYVQAVLMMFKEADIEGRFREGTSEDALLFLRNQVKRIERYEAMRKRAQQAEKTGKTEENNAGNSGGTYLIIWPNFPWYESQSHPSLSAPYKFSISQSRFSGRCSKPKQPYQFRAQSESLPRFFAPGVGVGNC